MNFIIVKEGDVMGCDFDHPVCNQCIVTLIVPRMRTSVTSKHVI